MSRVLGVSWYRLRSTIGHRWGGLVVIVLLIGLVGGLAMGAIAAARRTQSSFPVYLASTNPSDLIVLHNDSINDSNQTDPAFLRALAAFPQVTRVESTTDPSDRLLGPNGTPLQDAQAQAFGSSVQVLADVSGEFYDQDRPTVLEGRLANPRRADEMVMTAGAAQVLHLRIGDVVHLGFYTNAQTLEPGYGSAAQVPRLRIGIRLVGIVRFSLEVIRDDFDGGLRFALLTPALTRPLDRCCANGVQAGVKLVGGSSSDAAVEDEIKQHLPNSSVFLISAVEESAAERALAPLSIALGVFGVIAALAALVIAGQAIGRQLRAGDDELDTLRALGASPSMTLADGLLGVFIAVSVGTILAAVVAIALSPLAPLGPVRSVYPHLGVAFDGVVLGTGVLALLLVLGSTAVVSAYRLAPHRVRQRAARRRPIPSRAATFAATAGLPISGLVGVRFALDPGPDRRRVPVRSAILGSIVAIFVVVTTVVFGASLTTLVSHPALYGWNWDDEMIGAYSGLADVPFPQTGRLLDRDPYVAAWSQASFDDLRLDGQDVAVLGTTPNAAVAPPILSGHGLDASDQVVLGPLTLAELHKHVGDTVMLDNGQGPPIRLVIVGTATLPAIGAGLSLHLEIGNGAVLAQQLIPEQDRGFGDLPGSPEAMFVRFHPGANLVAARRSLEQIAQEVGVIKRHGPPSVVSVQRPAEIVNYRAMGGTAALLAVALAAGAVLALGLTLVASVRRRRRELALLKTLGFTRRQLAATVSWQSSVAVLVGVLVGVPLGIAAGRALWIRFADALSVVPQPTVNALPIVLIVVGALLLANLVAAVPGLRAARTPAALVLHAE